MNCVVEQPHRKRSGSSKGALTLLSEPLRHISSSGRVGDKHKKKHENDLEQASTFNMEIYTPSEFEFTLLYFCDSTCRNSLRFAKILTTFVQICNKTDNDRKPVELICIPNDESSHPTRLYDGPFADLYDFWHLGLDYKNRLALIYMLSVSKVPTLVVLNNQNGMMITNKGMEVVESYDPIQYENVLHAWRDGSSGLGSFGTISSMCEIM